MGNGAIGQLESRRRNRNRAATSDARCVIPNPEVKQSLYLRRDSWKAAPPTDATNAGHRAVGGEIVVSAGFCGDQVSRARASSQTR